MAAKQLEKSKEAGKKITASAIPFSSVHIKAPVLSEKNQGFISGPLKVDETRLFVTNFPYTIS